MIRTIDGFVGIIDEFVRTMDYFLRIDFKKMPNWAGPTERIQEFRAATAGAIIRYCARLECLVITNSGNSRLMDQKIMRL